MEGRLYVRMYVLVSRRPVLADERLADALKAAVAESSQSAVDHRHHETESECDCNPPSEIDRVEASRRRDAAGYFVCADLIL